MTNNFTLGLSTPVNIVFCRLRLGSRACDGPGQIMREALFEPNQSRTSNNTAREQVGLTEMTRV